MTASYGLFQGFIPGGVIDALQDVRWSADELTAEAGRRAAVLGPLMSTGRERFLIAHGDSPSFFADLFAVWRAGGVAVCLNPSLTDHELETVAAFIEPAALLTEGRDATISNAPTLRTADERPAGTAPSIAEASDAPALILFTSGTTGAPKGVVHTRRSIAARLALNREHIGPDPLSMALSVLPTHFGHGLIGNCLTPLSAGGDLVLAPGGGVAVAAGLGRMIERFGIRFMSSVPAFWRLATRISPPPAGGGLRRVHIGSAPLGAELWRQVIEWSGADVVNMYGITETANWAAGASSAEFAPEDGLVGRTWGLEARVLCDDGVLRASGVGEIRLSGPSIMQGYFRRPDLDAAVLEDGWYATGDIGRLEDGVLRLTGRSRYAINVAGIKVYPEEIDLLLERHPDVIEACGFALADAAAGQTVAAAVALRPGAEADGAAIIAWARRLMRAEAVPRRIFVLDDLPKSARGKLDRDAVAERCRRGPAL